MAQKLYPESGVELNPFISKNYDRVINIGSFGLYKGIIHKAMPSHHCWVFKAIECNYAAAVKSKY